MKPPRLIAFCFAALLGLLGVTTAFAAPASQDEIIVPNASRTAAGAENHAPGSGTLTMLGIGLLAGAGGWLLWRGRKGGLTQFNRTQRHLVIEETRSLGSRQYLVVAAYQEKKFLLGVCPGRIDLLVPLNDAAIDAADAVVRPLR